MCFLFLSFVYSVLFSSPPVERNCLLFLWVGVLGVDRQLDNGHFGSGSLATWRSIQFRLKMFSLSLLKTIVPRRVKLKSYFCGPFSICCNDAQPFVYLKLFFVGWAIIPRWHFTYLIRNVTWIGQGGRVNIVTLLDVASRFLEYTHGAL